MVKKPFDAPLPSPPSTPISPATTVTARSHIGDAPRPPPPYGFHFPGQILPDPPTLPPAYVTTEAPSLEQKTRIEDEVPTRTLSKKWRTIMHSPAFVIGFIEIFLAFINVFISLHTLVAVRGSLNAYFWVVFESFSPQYSFLLMTLSVTYRVITTIMGTSLCCAHWYPSKVLYSTYLNFGMTRMWLCLFEFAYVRHIYYMWNFEPKMMSMLATMVFSMSTWFYVYYYLYKPQKVTWAVENSSPPSYDSQVGQDCLDRFYKVTVIVVGMMEIFFGWFFLWTVYAGLYIFMPINAQIQTPLWIGMIIFGVLLFFNHHFKNLRIYKGYMTFSTIRMIIGIAFGIFLAISIHNYQIRADRLRHERDNLPMYKFHTEVEFGGKYYDSHGPKADKMRDENRKYNQTEKIRRELEYELNGGVTYSINEEPPYDMIARITTYDPDGNVMKKLQDLPIVLGVLIGFIGLGIMSAAMVLILHTKMKAEIEANSAMFPYVR